MTGNDCTPEQLVSASEFLRQRGWADDLTPATMRRETIVRLVAWYGALRFMAARDGNGGTLERPGVLETIRVTTPETLQ